MRAEDLQSILDTRHETFHIPGLEIVTMGTGHVVCRLEVTKAVANGAGNLHGGAAATLVDVVGTLAIVTIDRHRRPGVSTDLNISWFNASPIGDVILIDARVPKTGRTLAFTTVDISREQDGTLLAQGRMTKALGPAPKP